MCWQPSTAATIALLFTAFWILVVLSRPFRLWKAALVGSMVAPALAFIIPLAQQFFHFSLTPETLSESLPVGSVGRRGSKSSTAPNPACVGRRHLITVRRRKAAPCPGATAAARRSR